MFVPAALITVLLTGTSLSAQKPDEGQEIIKVYGNYQRGLTDADRSNAFEIRRVYLGYKQGINEFFTAEAKLDIGSPEDLSQYSLIRRYAYFKTASLTYSKDRLKAWFGLFDMLQFKLQEDFWGYRYLYKSFMDEYKFGPSADIGAGVGYRFSDRLEADLIFSNGEGYKSLQSDNAFKSGVGITLKPADGLKLRLYYDYIHIANYQNTFAGFIGYSRDNYRFAGEYNLRTNNSFETNHNLTGWSFYGTYVFSEEWEVFARYDKLNSNLTGGSEVPWNLYNDGSAVISGIQYAPVNGIKFALNYQDWIPFAANGANIRYIYLNLEFKI
jgi:hypothetical protein